MRFIIAVILTFTGLNAYASAFSFDNVENVSADIKKRMDVIQSDWDSIYASIRKLDSKFADNLDSNKYKDEEKIMIARNWLALHAYYAYKDAILNDIYARSRDTKRDVKTDYLTFTDGPKQETYMQYWLDRGNLDSDKCHRDDFIICEFPDGFEEYEVNLTESILKIKDESGDREETYNNRDIHVEYDKSAQNENRSCQITLSSKMLSTENANKGNNYEYSAGNDIFIEVTCLTEKYNEHAAWRNFCVQDARNGLMFATHEEFTGCDMLPDARVYSSDIEFNSNISRKHTEKKVK